MFTTKIIVSECLVESVKHALDNVCTVLHLPTHTQCISSVRPVSVCLCFSCTGNMSVNRLYIKSKNVLKNSLKSCTCALHQALHTFAPFHSLKFHFHSVRPHRFHIPQDFRNYFPISAFLSVHTAQT